MKSLYNGQYLVTHTRRKFLQSPEIFLLLADESGIRGFCLNAYATRGNVSQATTDPQNAERLGDRSRAFTLAGLSLTEHASARPFCFGGPYDGKDYHVIHIGPSEFPNTRVYSPRTFHVTPFVDFLFNLRPPNPQLFSSFIGYQDFFHEEIADACRAGDWSLRVGLHHFAYGDNLARKTDFIDWLSVFQPPRDLDPMSIMACMMPTMMTLAQERQIMMTRITVHGYFRAVRKCSLDDAQADEIVKVMLGISQTEGNNVLKIMEQFTLTELIEKYKKIQDSGIELTLVKAFEDRQAMLDAIGLESLAFDLSYFKTYLEGLNKNNPNPPTDGGYAADRLETQMEQVAAIIEDHQASEE